MSNPPPGLQQTISILQKRNIDIDREVLQDFFGNPQNSGEAAPWVDEYLREATLLSKEEATLFANLQSGGITKSIETSHDLATLRPILDDDVQRTISSLKASTAAIEKQTETLKLQWKLLTSLTTRSRESEAQSAKDSKQLDRKYALEKQDVAITTEELFQDFQRNLGESQDQAEKATRTIGPSMMDNFKEDDRRLQELEKMGDDSDLHILQAKDLISRTDKLISKLMDYMTRELECRLDRIYLETSYRFPGGHTARDEDSIRTAALKEELDTLYSEIRVLAEIATQQELKNPIIKAVRDQETHLKATSRMRLTYASLVLQHFLGSSEERQKRLQAFAAQRLALNALAISFRHEVVDLGSSHPMSPTKTKWRSLSPRKDVPITCKPENHDETQAVTGLLRHLGIIPVSRGEIKIGEDQVDGAVIARKERLKGMIRRLDSVVDPSVLIPLTSSESAMQLLSDALHTDSVSGWPNLPENESHALLTQLEERMQVVASSIEDTDMDAVLRRDKRLERFIETWRGAD